MCESDTGGSNDSGSNDNGSSATVTPAAPAPAPAPAPAKEAITGIAAGEIGVDENGNSYKVVDKGGYTTRDYSVDQPASAAPASSSNDSSNTLAQTIANVLTPNDGKEYVNGELVTPTSFADTVLADTNSYLPPTSNAAAQTTNNDNQQFVDTYNQQSVNAEIFPTAASTASGSMQTPSSKAAASEGNSLFQDIANAITPFDDKQYVNGTLVDTTTGNQTNTFVQNVANSITPNDDQQYVGGELVNTSSTAFADSVLNGSAENFLPGASEDSNNDGVKDVDAFTNVFNTQVDAANDDPYGQSTSTGFNNTDGSVGVVNNSGVVDVSSPTTTTNTPPQDTGPTQAEIDEANRIAAEKAAEEERQRLAALRQSAIDGAMGRLADAFGFATDDYFTGLGTEYEEGGLSPAFTTAYDDAVRGMYDVYKSAGLLNQADVDDDLNFLSSSQGSEQDRLDNIVSNYVTANREYVDSGRNTIADQINALGTVDEINNFDVVSAAQPYRQPTEQSVVDFFTDFAKRSYDPSYNVDPSAVSSGGPRRVSGSVDQLGTNTQPSTVAGIFDPLRGSSARVVA